MSDANDPKKLELGTVGWTDLTVSDVEQVRDFYAAVAGWKPEPLDMGGYSDFVMKTPGNGTPVAGICHPRGPNAALPAQWLIYITVADLDYSIERCIAYGGAMIIAPKEIGSYGRYCVIQDPAGAAAALIEPPA